MVKDMTAVVAAASPHRGIGYQGMLVRCVCVVFDVCKSGCKTFSRHLTYTITSIIISHGNYLVTWNILRKLPSGQILNIQKML